MLWKKKRIGHKKGMLYKIKTWIKSELTVDSGPITHDPDGIPTFSYLREALKKEQLRKLLNGGK